MKTFVLPAITIIGLVAGSTFGSQKPILMFIFYEDV